MVQIEGPSTFSSVGKVSQVLIPNWDSCIQRLNQTHSWQGQAQEFGLWFMVLGPTGPLKSLRHLKPSFDNILLEHVGLPQSPNSPFFLDLGLGLWTGTWTRACQYISTNGVLPQNSKQNFTTNIHWGASRLELTAYILMYNLHLYQADISIW